VISPLLLNIALHGMEAALGVKYDAQGDNRGNRAVVRYADDLVVLCKSQEDALFVKEQILPKWLAERGLKLSEAKTRIVHLEEGFDFLGFTIRHYLSPRTSRDGVKLLIRPSRSSVNGFRKKMREIWRSLKGHRIDAVLRKLNPIIRGWANYFRKVVASETFGKLDVWMLHRAYQYARSMHPNKPWRWRKERYRGCLHPKRKDQWVFGDKGTGQYLLKFSWFKIERHRLVQGRASPDDPSLREYWWSRQKVNLDHLSMADVELANRQDWYCPICGMELINGEALERHHWTARSEGGTDSKQNRALVHLYCHQQLTAKWRKNRRREEQN
jgi:RNA-directed DNA polymerase